MALSSHVERPATVRCVKTLLLAYTTMVLIGREICGGRRYIYDS